LKKTEIKLRAIESLETMLENERCHLETQREALVNEKQQWNMEQIKAYEARQKIQANENNQIAMRRNELSNMQANLNAQKANFEHQKNLAKQADQQKHQPVVTSVQGTIPIITSNSSNSNSGANTPATAPGFGQTNGINHLQNPLVDPANRNFSNESGNKLSHNPSSDNNRNPSRTSLPPNQSNINNMDMDESTNQSAVSLTSKASSSEVSRPMSVSPLPLVKEEHK